MSQGGKGGVGKTFIMVHICEYVRMKNLGYLALDLDDENKKYSSLQHWIKDAIKYRVNDREGLDVLLEATDKARENGKTPVIVADLKAGMGHMSSGWFRDVGGATQDEIDIVLVSSVTEDSSTVEGLVEWAKFLRDRVKYAVFKNPMADNNLDFSGFDDNTYVKKFIELANPSIATVPSVLSELMSLCRDHGVTLRQVAEGDHEVSELKNLRWKTRARSAWQGLVEAFDSVFDQILPSEEQAEAKAEPAKKGKREAAKA